jgi:tetratricopeptide (TPR) repeat protein
MADELETALAEFPDHPGVLYNLACAESRAGRHDAALEHLGRALELRPSMSDWAQQDDDLAAIRGRLEWPASGV